MALCGALPPLPPWPPAGGLTTIISPLNVTVVFISASTHIDAPANLIWGTLRDTTAYPDWNTFCPAADITSQANLNLPPEEERFLNTGSNFTLTVALDPSDKGPDDNPVTSQNYEYVTDFSTPDHPSEYVPKNILDNSGSFYPDVSRVHRIAWSTNTKGEDQPDLFTERFNEIIDLGEGKGCEYHTWENQGGPFAQQVKDQYGDILNDRFNDWCRDLKKQSEQKCKKFKRD